MEKSKSSLSLSDITLGSRVNGPGERAVIHFQGCSLACPGCFNVHTWTRDPNKRVPIEDVVGDVGGYEGITISGGEPFEQFDGLMELVEGLRDGRPNRGIIVFTGYTKSELIEYDYFDKAVKCIDVLIMGRYDRTKPNKTGMGLTGSTNQEVLITTGKYSSEEIISCKMTYEIIIDDDGAKLMGFPSRAVIKTFKGGLR